LIPLPFLGLEVVVALPLSSSFFRSGRFPSDVYFDRLVSENKTKVADVPLSLYPSTLFSLPPRTPTPFFFLFLPSAFVLLPHRPQGSIRRLTGISYPPFPQEMCIFSPPPLSPIFPFFFRGAEDEDSPLPSPFFFRTRLFPFFSDA